MPDKREQERTYAGVESDDGFFAPGHVMGGRYKVVSVLGKGGMGTVYKALQVFLNKEFAVKVLDRRRVSEDVQMRRFQLEAKAAHSLNHPNLVKVQDFGLLDDSQPYLVMDLVEGITLADFIRENSYLSVEQTKAIFTQVCSGLAYAHDQHVVHRDIKPSNIMIVKNIPLGIEGSVKILDFGIAKIASDEGGEIQQLTRTGEIFGSPLYMSPEQCTGDLIDHRSDIYSLGCVIFESLTGTPPHFGSNALRTMMMHQTEPAPLLKEASLGREFPESLEQMVRKMLQKAPSDRYQNLSSVAHALQDASADHQTIANSATKQKTAPKKEKTISMSKLQLYALLTGAVVSSSLVTTLIAYEIAQNSPHDEQKTKQQTPQTAESNLNGSQNLRDNEAIDFTHPEKVPTNNWEIKPGEMKSTIIATPNGAQKIFHFPSFAIGKISNSFAEKYSLGKIHYREWPAKNNVEIPADTPVSLELDSRFCPAPFMSAPILARINPGDFTELILKGNPIKEPNEMANDLVKVLKIAKNWTALRAISLYSIDSNYESLALLNQMKNVRYLILEGISMPKFRLLKPEFFCQLKAVSLLKTAYNAESPEPIIEVLAKSNNLERLELDRTHVSSSAVEKLRHCSNLTHVVIRNGPPDDLQITAPISDVLLDVLIKFPHLKRLSLQSTLVTPDQFKTLTKASQIKEIFINSATLENFKKSNCNDARVKVCYE